MRKLALALALTLIAASAHAAGYTGRWTLDKARSTGLPPYYDQITSHELSISETGKQLVVGIKVSSTEHDPDTMELRYNLDGSPSQTESIVRTPSGTRPVPTTIQMKRNDRGGLTITIERELPMRGGEMVKGTTVETWSLDAEGKVLTIDRVDDSPRGRRESKMVFTRG